MLQTAIFAAILGGGAPAPLRAQGEAPHGAIRGTVTDKDFEVPLAGVRVTVVEALLTTLTSPGGTFFFEHVPPGTYTLTFSKDGYEREVVPDVRVGAGQLAELRADLGAEVVDLEELVVSGTDLLAGSETGLLEVRAAAVSVQDAISSEIMSKAGVSDVAGALKLVVGTSIVGGKYATVRGLSDRYTGTTLNGVRVPSADPRRRAVQMDLFPTGTIESVTVTKTFTPDLQGDFTGGGVDIKTRSIPEKRLLSLSVSAGYNEDATRQSDFLTYKGGGVDPLGFDRGSRDLPAEARQPLPPFPTFSVHPSQLQIDRSLAYDRLVRSFATAMGTREEAPGPNQGFSALAGNRFALGGDGLFGLIGALTYTHKYDFYDGGQNNNAAVSNAGQPITLTRPRSDSEGTDEVLAGFLGSAVLQPAKDQEISLRLILNQSAEDEARLQVQDTGFPSVEQNQSLHYTERTVGSAQLHGAHAVEGLHDLALDWTLARNYTRQDEPDVRFFRNVFNFGTLSGERPSNSTEAQNTRRIYRTIDEHNDQGGLNAMLPFRSWTKTAGRIKAGLLFDRTDRDYDQRSFTYKFTSPISGSIFNCVANYNRSLARFVATSPDELWTDVFLSPERLGIASKIPVDCPPGSTEPAPNQLLWTIQPLGDDVDYSGEQSIDAAYAMTELPLSPKLKLIGGARRETTDLSVVPVNPAIGTVQVIEVQPESGDRAIVSVPQDEATAVVRRRSLLPSAGLVYEPRPGMNLRFSWSRTIARPTFRELAPVATEEFIFGDEFIGNPGLTLSRITNYDLRWEWLGRGGDVLAASLFYKRLQDPIELISFSASNRSFIQPVNYDRGRVQGFELEARTSLGGSEARQTTVSVGGNFTLISSEVDVPEPEQKSLAAFGLDAKTRRLQGQPSYLLNLNLTYDDDLHETSAGIFYNLVGETLSTGAARGVEDGNPDVFEERFGTLDLKINRKLGKGVSISLRAENLLKPERRSVYRTPDGDEAVKSERRTARVFTTSVTYSW